MAAVGSGRLVHAALIVDFDVRVGDRPEHIYPPDAPLPLPLDELSALAIPEGGHLFDEDHTHLVLPAGGTAGASGAAESALYGLAYFLNTRDADAARGAVMRSLLLLARRPYFSFFLPLLRAALGRYNALGPAGPERLGVLRDLVDAINDAHRHRALSMSLLGSTWPVDMGTWHEGAPYPGASLLDVVRRFREDTLLLWWALILHRRVIFCGQPAHKVGNCCLAAPLLVAPLGGFGAALAPHVPLSHPQRIEEAPDRKSVA